MKDQLIEFETAKLAKEKGFKSKSRYYDGSGKLVDTPNISENDYSHTNNMMQRFRYEAPTQSLLQRWLRELYDIHISIDRTFNKYKKEWKYTTRIGINIPIRVLSSHEKYEEALEEGLQQSLNLIKNDNRN